MYQESDRFNAPTPDAVLWRYMSYTKFVSLLARHALFFARADKLGDPFEGSLSQVNITLRPEIYKNNLPEEYQTLLANYIKDLRRFVLVNCWHENDYESDAMWKLYSRNDDGIAIRTDFSSLSESLIDKDRVFIGRVNYVDYDTTFIRENDPRAPFVHKRKSFEHQKEVRAIIQKIPVVDGKIIVGSAPDMYRVGTYHKVDTSRLIKEVVVPPYAEDWFVELVQGTTEIYKLQVPVRKSSLAAQPVWL